MSEYEAVTINDKTVWVPKQQEPVQLPKQAARTTKAPYAKRIGRKYGERKNWW